MSVQVSQLNRAVSMASVEAITTVRQLLPIKLFALPGNNNIVDGTHSPFTNEVDSGWWGNELSEADGFLPNPAILTVSQRLSAYLFILSGIGDNYPVDFKLELYKDSELIYEVDVTDNTNETYELMLDEAYDIDTYVLTIYRISSGNNVLKVSTATFGTHIFNLMKSPARHIHGRVEVAYSNIIGDTTVTINEGANGSLPDNISHSPHELSAKFFKLFDNKLDGSYKVIGQESEAGWWPKTMPDSSGVYAEPYTFTMEFSMRTLYGFNMHCGNDYPVDFNVRFIGQSGLVKSISVTGNKSTEYSLTEAINNVTKIEIDILKSSSPNRPAIITTIPIDSVVVYNDENLIDISLLEELTYEDELEKLGGVSANELTINFNNQDKSFYFNNASSPIAKYLKKNKRIKAWLGVEVSGTGNILWSPLGVFWTHSWDVPVGSLLAKCTAFDTLGLLSSRPYYKHYVYRDKSLGELIDIVLTAAKEELEFIEWRINPALYDIIIPMTWFNNASYTAALNTIASCDLLNIYCDRNGVIVADRKLSTVDSPDDVWSDSTNVISKSYPTLHTSPANHIRVDISKISIIEDEILNIENINESISAGEVCTYNFNSTLVTLKNLSISTTATYTYEVYSWGIEITFTSDGVLNSITVNADAISIDKSSSVLLRNEEAISEDGVVECHIQSDLIQTVEHASRLAAYIFNRSGLSMYDTEVEYRGDISLTLNNVINLSEGIAPTNLYYIKRHELYWNGSLRGSARLNT